MIPSHMNKQVTKAQLKFTPLLDLLDSPKPLQAIDNARKIYGKENETPGTFQSHRKSVSAASDSNDAVDGPPSWFVPALEMVLAPLQRQLEAVTLRQDGMESRLQNMETRFAMMEARQMSLECKHCRTEAALRIMDQNQRCVDSRVQNVATRQSLTEDSQRNMAFRLHNMEARQGNFHASQMADPLFELWNSQFEVPEFFPATLEAAFCMSEKDMTSFLDHYNLLPVPPSLEEKRLAIHRFIGIRSDLSQLLDFPGI